MSQELEPNKWYLYEGLQTKALHSYKLIYIGNNGPEVMYKALIFDLQPDMFWGKRYIPEVKEWLSMGEVEAEWRFKERKPDGILLDVVPKSLHDLIYGEF